MLTTSNHDRDSAGLTYVYPVISRRAGGVSLGINLNPNNRCNWQCIYCQVPDLQRGVAPYIDLSVLEADLDQFLAKLLDGSYMQEHVPAGSRKLCDLAISGNGEPTTCPNFAEVVQLIVQLMQKHDLSIPLRLITNGSSVHKAHVQTALRMMQTQHGEVWYKVDGIGEAITQRLNGVSLSEDWQLKQLGLTTSACATWLQTCVLQQQTADESYAQDYLAWLKRALEQGIKLEGVLLYGLARPSMQQGGSALESADVVWMQRFAQSIEALGLSVRIS